MTFGDVDFAEITILIDASSTNWYAQKSYNLKTKASVIIA